MTLSRVRDLWRRVALAALAGSLTGALAAAAEVLGLFLGWFQPYQSGAAPTLVVYGIAVYGAMGAAGGVALALVAQLVRPLRPPGRLVPLTLGLSTAGFLWAISSIYVDEVMFKLGSTARLIHLLNGLLAAASLLPGALVFLLATLWARRSGPIADTGARLLARRSALAVLLAALFGPLLFALWGTRRAGSAHWTRGRGPAPPRPNVILIVMDTTRADHVSSYGYVRPTTPNLDRIASEGVRFANVMATAPWTLPSIASMLTGLFPSTHGADHGHWRLDPSDATLAQLLRANGYATAGFVGGPFCKALFGLAQGFDTYDDALDPLLANLAGIRWAIRRVFPSLFDPQRRAHEINARVFDWLDRETTQPFFLFINYFDPHDPYDPPRPYDRRWGDPYAGRVDGFIDSSGVVQRYMRRELELGRADWDHLLALYDGEIAYLDDQMARLFDKLRRLGALDNSILVITADHGESFGEHALISHGNSLYEDQLRVPLVLRYPARFQGGRVVEPTVQPTDIMPTILALLGIPTPGTVQGRNLLPLVEGTGEALPGPAIAELPRGEIWAPLGSRFERGLLAVREGSWKYIRASDGTDELYHVERDPLEAENLVEREPHLRAAFRARLEDWSRRAQSGVARGSVNRLDRATREQLRRFGY